jgi:hypothetical protein
MNWDSDRGCEVGRFELTSKQITAVGEGHRQEASSVM